MRKVYLDHSATTPVRPEVVDTMNYYLQEAWGNPSSIHSFGKRAKKGLEEARERVAGLIGASPETIFFTSGGTEADNLAIKGTAYAKNNKGKHIITSQIEHHAVLDSCRQMEKEGFEVTYLPVDSDGIVRVDELLKALRDDTILISLMHVNNEVGTIQPVEEVGKIARERGITYHIDAVQSAGKIMVNIDALNADLLTVSAHKIYGPKGVGCLYVRPGVVLHPLIQGGGQEKKRRPGTENIPGIVGFGKAAELAAQELYTEHDRLIELRERLIEGILNTIPEVKLNGHRTLRIPGSVNVSIRYIEGESILLGLDMKGIAASSGSACTSGSLDPSHVLLAMGMSHEMAHGSVRMTLGRDNTLEDIDYVLEVLPNVVERLRAMSPLYKQGESSTAKECCQRV